MSEQKKDQLKVLPGGNALPPGHAGGGGGDDGWRQRMEYRVGNIERLLAKLEEGSAKKEDVHRIEMAIKDLETKFLNKILRYFMWLVGTAVALFGTAIAILAVYTRLP